MHTVTDLFPFFFRELSASRASRVYHVFAVLALLVGASPLALGLRAEAAPLFLLQGLLYVVPLFAILIGTSSSQSEASESLLLAAAPVGQGMRVLGKMLGLATVLAITLLLLAAPSLASAAPIAHLVRLWSYGVGLGLIFAALGMAIGYRFQDPVKAHLASLIVWMTAVFGGGLLALLLAGMPAVQSHPVLWTLTLALNPLEACRIGMLFQIEAIPFDLSKVPPFAAFWLNHTGLWFTALCTTLTTLAMFASRHVLKRGH